MLFLLCKWNQTSNENYLQVKMGLLRKRCKTLQIYNIQIASYFLNLFKVFIQTFFQICKQIIINSTDSGISRGLVVDLVDLFPNSGYSITIKQKSIQQTTNLKSWKLLKAKETNQNDMEAMWSPILSLKLVTLPAGWFSILNRY